MKCKHENSKLRDHRDTEKTQRRINKDLCVLCVLRDSVVYFSFVTFVSSWSKVKLRKTIFYINPNPAPLFSSAYFPSPCPCFYPQSNHGHSDKFCARITPLLVEQLS